MNDIIERFQEMYFEYSEDSIFNLNSVAKSGEINAVITGLNEKCYAVMLLREPPDLIYRLTFISGKPELRAFGIDFTHDEKEIEFLTFAFARFLSENYPHLNLIDVFNTFQSKVRQMFEMIDILTIADSINTVVLPEKSTILAKGVKGIKKVYFIDKLGFYRDLFSSKDYSLNELEEKCVYLMLNEKDGLIKIGQSKNPKIREKTLMSQEPDIQILVVWKAPVSVELELHKLFDRKRKRGEWFNLNFQDLEDIKNHMLNYEQIECY